MGRKIQGEPGHLTEGEEVLNKWGGGPTGATVKELSLANTETG